MCLVVVNRVPSTKLSAAVGRSLNRSQALRHRGEFDSADRPRHDDVGEQQVEVEIRITSYNVCYTKLLRLPYFHPTTVVVVDDNKLFLHTLV